MTVPGALNIISEISEAYKDEDVITVQAQSWIRKLQDLHISRGAIHSKPNLNLETLKICNRYRVPSLPGVIDS